MSQQPTTVLDAFRRTATSSPDRPMMIYVDDILTAADVDRASDAFALALVDNGFGAGDRLALYLQNVPQYVIGLIAAWKLGGIGVPINPMLTPREVGKLVADATPAAMLTLDELHTPEIAEMLSVSSVRRVFTTLAAYDGRRPDPVTPSLDDPAVISYTSGTTGTPKGAINTHRNVAVGGHAYRDWFQLDEHDVVLGVAPLFHVTGLTGHIACSIVAGAPLILSYRFDSAVVLDMIRKHKPTFTVGAITVFIALANTQDAAREDFATLTKIASGGAPVAAATAERFEQRFGVRIHNVYGMTETTSPVLAVPLGAKTPVEAETGALSVGVPMLTASVAVFDDDGAPLPAGEVGELAVAGPQTVPGYWHNADATSAGFRDGWLLTGDVGYADDDGWYYLVDRKKDMIVASGFKVWPREVEDVLYAHEAVLEAAVVGTPDAYRGESVKAYVSLREGFSVGPDELIDYCRTSMAAYKYPRAVEIVDAIPKTATGKILRRSLRG
jgi:long-chain acyl-CoA synthetase